MSAHKSAHRPFRTTSKRDTDDTYEDDVTHCDAAGPNPPARLAPVRPRLLLSPELKERTHTHEPAHNTRNALRKFLDGDRVMSRGPFAITWPLKDTVRQHISQSACAWEVAHVDSNKNRGSIPDWSRVAYIEECHTIARRSGDNWKAETVVGNENDVQRHVCMALRLVLRCPSALRDGRAAMLVRGVEEPSGDVFTDFRRVRPTAFHRVAITPSHTSTGLVVPYGTAEAVGLPQRWAHWATCDSTSMDERAKQIAHHHLKEQLDHDFLQTR
ncbi:hypothetical protein EDB85DRAFT_1949689 [Lactarius pseudohatsudake]|nr:hypothetical protein EDB85DRAFT_1949689 [Lactarius pseudohatsudake]